MVTLKVSLSDRIQRNKDQSCFILDRTVVSKLTVTLVNQQKIQQLRMFIIPVGKQTTRRNGSEWIHLHKRRIKGRIDPLTPHHNLPDNALHKKSSNMTRLVKVTELRFRNRTECTSGATTINVTQFRLKTTLK